jgi:peroxiredoxin
MADTDLDALNQAAEQRWMEQWLEGPTLEAEALRRGDGAPEVELLAEDGSPVALSSFWSERPALVILWRHLGCGCGQDRARRLASEFQGYVDAGLQVVVVAPGDPQRVAAYREKYGVVAPMLADREYAAHRGFGLSHWSVEQVLYDAPDEWCELRRDTGEDFQAGRRAEGRPMVDDPWMPSAEFIVGTDGMIRIAYLYNYCEDFPDPRVFTTAARLAS